jgi:prophage tail gpP-like protein
VIITTPTHEVAINVGGTVIRDFTSYSIRTSLTDPADSFTMRRPFDREAWDLCRPDTPVQVTIDGTPVITGLVDVLDTPEDSYEIEITGRCMIGRLVDDCADTLGYSGLGIQDLIRKLASPFFSKVVFTAERDRKLRRGRGRKTRAGREPAASSASRRSATNIEPGQTRWQAIEQLLDKLGLLAWSSGDGRELIVAEPNYDQEPQFRFFRPTPGSARASEATVLGMGRTLSHGECYSRVMVGGSGAGTSVNFGAAAAARYGEAKNNDETVNGEGADFLLPKRLFVQRAVSSTAEARELAEWEMAKRDAQKSTFRVRCAGHGQRIAGSFTTLFANDLLAFTEHEPTGWKGVTAIVACTYQQSRDQSAETLMDLVLRGVVLA